LHVLGRLLDQLQQGVEPGRGDHVGLVDDEHLVAVAHRREGGPLAQLARIVHTAVAGGVDLDHVEAPGAAVREGAAGVALAARAGEQVGVTAPPGPQSTPQRRGDVVLADHFGEGLRAVTTVQSGGHPDRLVEAADAPHRCGVVRLWRNGEGCDHGDMMAGDGHSTGHSAVPRPRPTGAPQVLAALLALLACPSAAMAVFILVAGQQVALPHLVFCLLQLVILVPLVRGGARWLRPTRLSRPRDAAPPLLLLLAAVLVLGVTRLRAYWDGI